MKYLLVIMFLSNFLFASFVDELGIMPGDNIEKAKKRFPYYNEVKTDCYNCLMINNAIIHKIVFQISIKYNNGIIEEIYMITGRLDNDIILYLYNDFNKNYKKPYIKSDISSKWMTKAFSLLLYMDYEKKSISITLDKTY